MKKVAQYFLRPTQSVAEFVAIVLGANLIDHAFKAHQWVVVGVLFLAVLVACALVRKGWSAVQ